MRIDVNDDNSRKSNSKLKDLILDLFDQVREANARNAEKDRMITALTKKFDTVLENQRRQKFDLESWIAKERLWNMEREAMQKT